MFQHAFQNGEVVEVYDSKVNNTKDKHYQQLVKMVTPSSIK